MSKCKKPAAAFQLLTTSKDFDSAPQAHHWFTTFTLLLPCSQSLSGYDRSPIAIRYTCRLCLRRSRRKKVVLKTGIDIVPLPDPTIASTYGSKMNRNEDRVRRVRLTERCTTWHQQYNITHLATADNDIRFPMLDMTVPSVEKATQ